MSGATSNAGGTVTYKVYTNNTCNSANPIDAGTKTVTNGVVPDSNEITFNTVGTFYWQADYSGDANNDPAKSDCTTEQLVVTQPTSTISTAQSFIPQDTATLGTAGDSGKYDGALKFELFAGQSCAAPAVYTEDVNVPDAGVNPGTSFTTNNDGDPVDPNATPADTIAGYTINAGNATNGFSWKVTYSGDSVRSGVTSDCVEKSTLSITNS